MRNIIILTALSLGATTALAQPAGAPAEPAATAAPAAPALSVGATVYHTSGEAVGTIKAIGANGVVVSTGSNEVTIPAASFGAGANGPVLAATKADIDAAAGAANAQRTAAVGQLVVAGAPVKGAAGNVVGTIKARDGDFAVLTTPRGEVRLPLTSFAVINNALSIGMTAAEFDAAVATATQATRPGG
ncbi:hypothetical protein IP88_12880 [alpha proteobacterium AAP81b]|nr:hypothetical protein IP88_12880 [alpha proteobacterium AAP81b]